VDPFYPASATFTNAFSTKFRFRKCSLFILKIQAKLMFHHTNAGIDVKAFYAQDKKYRIG